MRAAFGEEPVWRVVDDETQNWTAAALDSGTPLVNTAPTFAETARL